MKKNELNLTPKSTTSISSITEPNNNSIKEEISEIFNKVYDRNFLSFINELSISILKFHKSFEKQSYTFKSLLNEINNQNFETSIEKIKNDFNQIDLLTSKYYSESKVIFKKMKLYRSNVIKNIKPDLNFRHKKSVSINLDIENNNKLNDLNDDFKYKKNSAISRDKIVIKDNFLNIPKIQNDNNDTSQNYNNNLSNYESNQSSNSNIINQEKEQEKNDPKENKNQNNVVIINYLDNLLTDLKSFDTSINLNSNNIDMDKISNINEYYEDKKNNLINFINNTVNDLKKNDNVNKDKINNLLNEINILETENNKIKQQFEKYRSDEKIKKKFMETQIMNLSKKELENSRNIKLKEKEFKEKQNEYEENISQLKNNIKDLENKINEKQNNLQNIINNKDKEISLINDKNKKICEDLNEKESKIKELLIKYDEIIKNEEMKENEIKQNKELINKLEEKNSELNKKNIDNENKKIILENKINNYEKEIKAQKEDINKQIDKNKK